MSKVIKFLTRTAGSQDGSSKIGATDVLAYLYLALGVLIILLPVIWTLLTSLKPERAVDNFDTRLLPIAQIEQEIEGYGVKSLYWAENEDGEQVTVFKTGPTRSMTEVAPVNEPEAIFEVPRRSLEPVEEVQLAVENYLDPILKRNGQENFHFLTYLVQLGVRDGCGHTDHAGHQLNGGLCLVQIQVQRPANDYALDHLHPDDSGHDHSGLHLLRGLDVGYFWLALGRDHTRRGDTYRRLPVAPIYADHSRRIA